jgi:hypothetical protein
MRAWGRTYDEYGNATWEEVSTDANGLNDAVRLTHLCQVLQGSPGESPFYANFGIPGQQSVMQQVFPDFYVALTQAYFAPFFANLQVQSVQEVDANNVPYPAYKITAITNQGAVLGATIPQ